MLDNINYIYAKFLYFFVFAVAAAVTLWMTYGVLYAVAIAIPVLIMVHWNWQLLIYTKLKFLDDMGKNTNFDHRKDLEKEFGQSATAVKTVDIVTDLHAK